MNTITTINATDVITLAINNANSGVFETMYNLGYTLNNAHKSETFKTEGFKSWNAFKKARIDDRTFRMGASSLDNAEKAYEFLDLPQVEFCQWAELSWTAVIILMGAVKFNEYLVEFVNENAESISRMKQKELQRFAKLLKEGYSISDALEGAMVKVEKSETVGNSEPTEGEGVETKIAIKDTLQNILVMMQNKEYECAENTLVELLATM